MLKNKNISLSLLILFIKPIIKILIFFFKIFSYLTLCWYIIYFFKRTKKYQIKNTKKYIKKIFFFNYHKKKWKINLKKKKKKYLIKNYNNKIKCVTKFSPLLYFYKKYLKKFFCKIIFFLEKPIFLRKLLKTIKKSNKISALKINDLYKNFKFLKKKFKNKKIFLKKNFLSLTKIKKTNKLFKSKLNINFIFCIFKVFNLYFYKFFKKLDNLTFFSQIKFQYIQDSGYFFIFNEFIKNKILKILLKIYII